MNIDISFDGIESFELVKRPTVRYLLTLKGDVEKEKSLIVLMANPSISNESKLDRTTNRIWEFFKEKYSVIKLINIFPVISSQPSQLGKATIDFIINNIIKEGTKVQDKIDNNLKKIKSLVKKEKNFDLLIATGNVEDVHKKFEKTFTMENFKETFTMKNEESTPPGKEQLNDYIDTYIQHEEIIDSLECELNSIIKSINLIENYKEIMSELFEHVDKIKKVYVIGKSGKKYGTHPSYQKANMNHLVPLTIQDWNDKDFILTPEALEKIEKNK